METNLNYESAYAELKEITEEIESETISVDGLAEKVKRASQLIEFCQTKLRTTEKEVMKIIQQMEVSKKKTE
ncbi:MAG: exodeoxyribonuclease VII small subunit [Chitinophagaceae bacterium]|jgi:exodeoxyribonuclease VII small subunit